MITLDVGSAIGYSWEALGVVWLAGLAFTKRVIHSQPNGPGWFHLILASTGFTLLGSHWFETGWMAARFVPEIDWLMLSGLALTIIGCAFAIWARITLGGNWSSRATVKEGHELIVIGPYSLARHPIYTGIMIAVLGTAFAIGQIRCLLGTLVILLALIVKMSQEERLMMQTFPEAYPRYRRRVKALIPGVL